MSTPSSSASLSAAPPTSAVAGADRRRAAVDAVQESCRAEARAFADMMRAAAELGAAANTQDSLSAHADGVMELAGSSGIGQSRAATRLDDARRLVGWPGMLAALDEGRVLRPSAEQLQRLVRHVSDAVAHEVAHRVLGRLTIGTTTDQRRAVEETVVAVEAELDPEAVARREADAAERDAVWLTPEADGRCVVGANLDVLVGRRWALDFEELVRAEMARDRELGIKRTRAHVRATVFAALPSQVIALVQAVAEGRTEELFDLARRDPETAAKVEDLAADVHDLLPVPIAPASSQNGRADWLPLAAQLLSLKIRDPKVVNVFVPLATVLDVDQRGGWVEGVGAVSPFRVRVLLADNPLRRVVCDENGQPQRWDSDLLPAPAAFDRTDPGAAQAAAEHVRGRLLAMLEPTVVADLPLRGHDPNPTQQAFVQLRDQKCVGIGCGTSSTDRHIELDHETRYDPADPHGGPTAVFNLSAKSPRCHHAKHHGWLAVRDDTTGDVTWTSPTGHTYTRPGVWPTPVPLPDALPAPTLHSAPEVPFYADSWDRAPLTAKLPEPAPEQSAQPCPVVPDESAPQAPRPPPDDTLPF